MQAWIRILLKNGTCFQRETVRTSKIRTSKVKKLIENLKKIRTSKVFFKLIRTSKVTKMEVDQNVKSDNNHQLDQNVENQNVEKNVKSQKSSKNTFDVLKFFDAIGNIRTSKVFCATTYGVLPLCTKACVGLG
jgi:hypothetical protein